MGTSIPTPRPARDDDRRRRCSERGSALVLVPTMVLVLLCLGAIAVDLSLVHAVHRDAHRVASVAADDAAAMIDEVRLQRTGELVVDAGRATAVVEAHVRTARLAGEVSGLDVEVGATTVDVRLSIDAPHVILPSLPGRDDSTRLTVTTRGRLHP